MTASGQASVASETEPAGPPEGLDEIPLSPGSETKKLVDAFKVDMATYA